VTARVDLAAPRYRTIVADPPWEIQKRSGAGGASRSPDRGSLFVHVAR
jgi:hypothetical protein